MPMAYVNGISLHYTSHGSGIPVIFIHPPLMSGANFEYQVKELSQYFRVISFDIRGHGRSHLSREKVTYSLIAEDIVSLMDYLELDKAFIAGYSTGGGIALEFMLNYPDRVYGGIVISGMSEVSDWQLRNEIRLAIHMSAKGWMKPLALAVSWGNADNPRQFRTFLKETSLAHPKNTKEYYESSLKYNCTADLWKITAPVLLVYGDKDKLFKRYFKILRKRLPYNEFVFIHNSNHRIPSKAAIEMNDLVKKFIYTHKPEKAPQRELEKTAEPYAGAVNEGEGAEKVEDGDKRMDRGSQ